MRTNSKPCKTGRPSWPQAHENQITQIKAKAEEERNARILSAERRMNDSIARGLDQRPDAT